MSNFVIIGAGVSGLTTALEILQANPTNKVTLISKQIPTDFQFNSNYTSPFAGANWESFASHEDTWQQDIDLVAYHKFKQLAKEVPESGIVERINNVLITNEKFQKDGEVIDYPWFASVPEMNFKKLSSSELTNGYAYGYSFSGVVISTTYYLAYLWNQCHKLGGDRFAIRRKTIRDFSEALKLHHSGDKPNFVINCTGLLARSLVSSAESSKLYTIRGVTILVENNIDELHVVETYDAQFPDEILYIMPRKEGGCVIGGCMEVGKDNETKVSSEQKDRILNRAKKHVPELLTGGNKPYFEIVREQVGFRPAREGGIRLELDNDFGLKYGIPLIHNYGHGGYGYQASYGCSKLVLQIADDYLNGKNSSINRQSKM